MKLDLFLEVLDKLEKNLPQDTPAHKLKNCYKRNPYTILMTTLLSLRTKDENTTIVATKLFNDIQTPQELLKININELEQIVRPTGMYKQKAKTLHEVSKVLIKKFNSTVPDNKEDLLSIKGIGEKTANIVLNNAFGISSIAVDTHVHRICNLLNFIATKDEKESSIILNKIIPRKYKSKLNFTLVAFGQTVCTVKNPKCDKCVINNLCPLMQTS